MTNRFFLIEYTVVDNQDLITYICPTECYFYYLSEIHTIGKDRYGTCICTDILCVTWAPQRYLTVQY